MTRITAEYYQHVPGVRPAHKFRPWAWWVLAAVGPIAWLIPGIIAGAIPAIAVILLLSDHPVDLAQQVINAPGDILLILFGGMSPIVFSSAGFIPLISPALMWIAIFSINRCRLAFGLQRGRMLMAYLENAVRLNLPLPSFLRAAELSERGMLRRQLRTMTESLRMGTSVAAGLHAARSGLSEQIAAEVAAAESNGRLRPALSRITEGQHRSQENASPVERPVLMIYLVILTLATLSILSFWMIFLLPKLREIMSDLRGRGFVPQFPAPTQWLISRIDYFGTGDVPIMFFLSCLAYVILIFMIGRQLRKLFCPWWPAFHLGRFPQWLAWHVPIVRALARDRAMAAACEVLAESLAAGKPLPEAVGAAAFLPTNICAQRRFDRWRTRLLAGEPTDSAAPQAGLGRLLVGFLDPRRAPHDTAGQSAMFGFLAQHYHARSARFAAALRGAIEPLAVVLMGLMVGFVVYSLFSPLVALINAAERTFFDGIM